jgi:hypothetical protein
LWKQQRRAEKREKNERGDAPILVGSDDETAADRGKRRDQGESDRHADEQRQTGLDERPVGAGEDERQHRQNTRAQYRQNAGEIRNGKQDHSDLR